jgi:ubiquinone/menaquinone biosynthesis C-methylase UbiE
MQQRSWLIRLYAWACERLYRELAWSYDPVSWLVSLGRWAGWRRQALRFLPTTVEPQAPVLELGFGTGELLLALAEAGLPAVGLEPSPAMHEITERKLRLRGHALLRVCAVGEEMPFADSAFGALIATFPAGYILDERTLAECARLLQPRGRLVILGLWVALRPVWLGRLVPLFYGEPPATLIPLLEDRFAHAGFRMEQSYLQDGPFAVAVLVAHKT